jgi:hypothetical protein
MNSSLLIFLSNFSWGAHCIALGLTGVACLRLSKRGADGMFAAAAWLALAGTLLICLPWMLSWVLFFLSVSPSWWGSTVHISNLSTMLLFGHFVLFAIAAFRTARQLPARVPSGQLPPRHELPAD